MEYNCRKGKRRKKGGNLVEEDYVLGALKNTKRPRGQFIPWFVMVCFSVAAVVTIEASWRGLNCSTVSKQFVNYSTVPNQ